jgi:hypothetical protein
MSPADKLYRQILGAGADGLAGSRIIAARIAGKVS